MFYFIIRTNVLCINNRFLCTIIAPHCRKVGFILMFGKSCLSAIIVDRNKNDNKSKKIPVITQNSASHASEHKRLVFLAKPGVFHALLFLHYSPQQFHRHF